ncbi:unnamed protein product [Cyclocybe aegerita]|uniref:F-box domain-containing protein n=1 Tax=Cyclocybe aegerita TaxID=1973307 RepID=A0A8S0VRD4_CYCAE|nr:unnamed protein product [Cyclocybe aegerita]
MDHAGYSSPHPVCTSACRHLPARTLTNALWQYRNRVLPTLPRRGNALLHGLARMACSTRATNNTTKRVVEADKPEANEEDVFGDSELSELSEDSSDEGSDYEATRRKSGKAPPAKKAKTGPGASKSTKSPGKKGSRQTNSLSLLPTMPLDVLFEVFSHLSPKDIINLARTSRMFRETLMTTNATTVWKTAREQVGAPDCPSYMSEPQWAVLLFGNVCQTCGAKNIQRVDFGLLRRVCTNCKKAHLVVESKFEARFPDIDDEVLGFVLYTKIGGWSHGYARSSRFFWAADIDRMVRKLAEYQHNVHLRRAGAQQALKDFKARRMELVQDVRENIKEREDWCDDFLIGRYRDKHAVIEERTEAIIRKFISLGYMASDVEWIRHQRECQQPALLTDRIWTRIRPLLEPAVLQKKRERLEREMKGIRSARRTIVHTSYQEFQTTLMPSQWKYLPRTVDICAMEPFAKVVDAEADVTVTVADFVEAFRQLPDLLSAALDARKLTVRKLFENRHHLYPFELWESRTKQPPPSAQEPEAGEIIEDAGPPSQPLDPLDLATTVFACQEEPCSGYGSTAPYLFGWDGIASHNNCRPDSFSPAADRNLWYLQRIEVSPAPPKVAFSVSGSTAVRAVVKAAGLDEKTATVSDMDAKDLRFECSACTAKKKVGATSWTKPGYKWRDFTYHCTVKHHSSVENVVVVISPENCVKVKEDEMNDPKRAKNLWTCGHCSTYHNLERREVVLEHLKTLHNISTAREPDDLFFLERTISKDIFEAGYPVDAPVTANGSVKTINCLVCCNGKPSGKNRVFNLCGVKSHLNDKHKIHAPIADVHYR